MKILENALKEYSKELLQKIITYGVNLIQFGSPSSGAQNVQGYWLSMTTPNVAATEFTVNHNLGYIPTGLIVVSVDQAAIVYSSRKASWTINQAFLKCNQASVSLTGFMI